MPVTHVPKYPVVDPDPSSGKAILNFGFTEFRNLFLFMASGYTVGWFGG